MLNVCTLSAEPPDGSLHLDSPIIHSQRWGVDIPVLSALLESFRDVHYRTISVHADGVSLVLP